MRKKRNIIAGIMTSQGSWTTDQKEMERSFEEYFQTIFSTTNPNADAIKLVLKSVKKTVIDQMNFQLLTPFLRSEIERALKQMHPSKASGPNGFPALLYQQF